MLDRLMTNEDTISSLREAIKVSPDNVPLRQHLGDSLCQVGRFEEAEREYTFALAISPDNHKLKLGLATAFYQSGKYTQSLVVVEDLLKSPNAPAKALIIHARLLLNDGQVEHAVRQYTSAVDIDPAVADPTMAERLGIGLTGTSSEVVDGRVRGHNESPDFDLSDEEEFLIERSTIKFDDVGGMDPIKDQVRMKIIYPLTNPEMFKAYGKKVGGGILLYGPPGCGKTYLAKATAGEINAGFMSVGISDVLDMWIGSSERNLHDVFEQARRNKPCVLFFDEVDALAASRSDMRGHAGRQVINQFLLELDGVDTSNDGILVLAATNAPWHLDSAFRRPGRFDRIIFVPPPDTSARAAILRILLRGKPVDTIDFEALARKTDKLSGADLQSVVDHAVEEKIEQAMKSGSMPKAITTKDLDNALKQVKPSTSEWFATAKNYAMYSNQGGAYDDILKYLKM
jgi:transitional endoplasmic reticulum ATPase